mgnify:FL=1
MELFEGLGVELKVERGRRVFPVSDKAEEIRQALLRYAQDADIVYDGAKKLLLEDIVPEAEPAPAAAENPRHPKRKRLARRCAAWACGALPAGNTGQTLYWWLPAA